MVGREEELALLLRRWDQAKSGEGRVVLISGEAGIGKSRVLAELSERIVDEPHVTVRYQCSPHRVNDAFFPITSQIWRAAGFVGAEPDAARLDKLEALIARSGLEALDITPFLAALLSIPLEGRYPLLEMAPSEQRERTIAALIALFEGLTQDAPVLLALEDAHWVDPTSLDVFGRIVDRLPNLRALLVVTFRPEFTAPWVGGAHVTLLPLSRFGRRDAVGLVERVTDGKGLPTEVLEQIVAKADGVPLFVEELTQAVLGSGQLREENGVYVLASALAPLAIPPTLQDSLMERLDRLAPVKEIAQVAAAIGREFSHRLLEAAAPIHGPALQSAVDQLMAAKLIHARGSPPEATYVFKHALVRDAAYASLIRSRRQRIHADIARAIEERVADRVDATPAIVAHHYAEAGLDDLAIEWWGKAGDQALRRSAFQEAIAHLGKAIEMTEALAGSGEADRTGARLKLQVAYGNAMIAAHGHGAPETIAAFQRAHELAVNAADVDSRFSSNYGLWAGAYVHGDLPAMLGPAHAFLHDVKSSPGSPEAGVAHRAYGVTQWFTGNYVEARAHFERAVAVFDPNRDRDLAFRFGQDVGVSATVYLAMALWPLGEVNRAREIADATAARIAKLNHLATSTYGLMHCAMFEIVARNVDRAAPLAKAVSSVAHEHGIALWVAFGAFLEAWVDLRSNASEIGLAILRRAADLLQRDNVGAFQPLVRAALAEAEARNGEKTAALATLDRSLKDFERSGQRWFDAELHRMRGEFLFETNFADPAVEEALLAAIAVARNQKARSFELRSTLALAKFLRTTRRDLDAHDMLGPALEGFSPTAEFPEIAEALEMLAVLESDEKE